MIQSEKQKFGQLMTDVMAYYGKDASRFMLSLWWDACQNMDFEQVAKALNQHAKDPERGQFAPKVADIVAILEGTTTERAAIAWGKTFEAMQRVGAYTDVVFDDPVIHCVIEDLGGWVKVCRSDSSELSYFQHRFTESYRAYASRLKHGTIEYPRALLGDRSPDEMYERRGLPAPKPAIIGDVVQARIVWRNGCKSSKTAINLVDMALLQIQENADTGKEAA